MRPKTVVISRDLDIVTARTAVRELARSLDFGSMDQARIATAVSELARNIFLYAGTGHLTMCAVAGRGAPGSRSSAKTGGRASRTSTW